MIPILVGILFGALVWFMIVRPWQLDNYERKRRALGFEPKRRIRGD